MSKNSTPSALARMTHEWRPYVPAKVRGELRETMSRVKINRSGYDASGAYWGAGHDVFLATYAGHDLAVRAKSSREALGKLVMEASRYLPAPRWITIPGKPVCLVRVDRLPAGFLWQVGKQCGHAPTLAEAREIAEAAREIFPRRIA